MCARCMRAPPPSLLSIAAAPSRSLTPGSVLTRTLYTTHPTQVRQVACGGMHSLALTEAGDVWMWGENWGDFAFKVDRQPRPVGKSRKKKNRKK